MILDKLHPILRKYRAPAGDNGSVEDRGDDWTPTDDDVDPENPDKGDDKEGKDAKAQKDDPQKKGADDKDDPEKDDPEAEEDPEKDDKGEKKTPKKDSRMPISRHKEILERERAAREDAERRLAQYERGDRVAVMNDEIKKVEDNITKLDEEYSKLITDGEHQKAADKMREIRRMERELGDLKSDFKAQVASTQAVEKVRYDTTVERLEAAYPQINPDSDDFDEEAARDVLDLAATYRGRGMTPSEAIQKAAKKLLKAETKAQERATEVTPRVNEDDPEVKAEARRQEKEAERRQAQVKKNVDTAKRQPADLTKVGADSDKAGGSPLSAKNVMKMSYDDFTKLDEATLARLRGDSFAAES